MDYTDCCYQVDYTAEGWYLQERLSFLVPVGFDGMFVCVGDGTLITYDYFQEYMKLYQDANTLFFRLK